MTSSSVQTVPTVDQGQVSPANPSANPNLTTVSSVEEKIPAPAPTASNPEELKQSLYQAWMQTQNQEAASDSVYRLEATTTGEIQGHNPTQGLDFSFQAEGVTLNGMNLALTGIGYQGQVLESLATVAPVATDNRVEYQRSAGLTEWYTNNSQGLEQGFTLSQAWPGQNGNELSLELSLTGGLFRSAGGGLEIVSDNGSATNYGGLYAYDATGQALPSRMEVGGEGQTARILVKLEGAQYPIVIDPLVQTQQFTASDGVTNDYDRFGTSVALSSDGNTALIGVPNKTITVTNNVAHTKQGAAYVFTRSGNIWSQQQVLSDTTTGAAYDYFGSAVALSSDGSTALIGAYEKTIGANSGQGAAYVFTRAGSTWSQQQVLSDTTTGATNEYFGWAVSLSSDGNTALIGAYNKGITGTNGVRNYSGAAYVFTRTGTTWSQQQLLSDTINGAGSDQFGWSVALSSNGNTALIGADFKTINGNNAQGAAYLFTRTGTTWSQQQIFTATNNTGTIVTVLRFGYAVALSSDGNTALIGAAGTSITGTNGYSSWVNTNQGAAYVFTRTGTTWSQQQILKDNTNVGSSSNWFGTSVSLSSSGNTALIGADQKNSLQGAAYLFTRTGTTWSQQQILSDITKGEPNDQFGVSVSLSGDGSTALIGAFNKNITATNGVAHIQQGAAYTFALPSLAITLTVNPVSTSTYGQAVTLTATFSSTNATGTVDFKDGSTTLNGSPVVVTNGVATFITSGLSTGSHTFTAAYSGNSNYAGSTSSNVPYTVNAVTSLTSLTANPFAGSISTQLVTLTATISPLTATGTVDFKDGSTTLNGSPVAIVSGVATFTTSSLIVGSHTFTATYSGDSKFASSSGNLSYMVYNTMLVTSNTDDGTGNTPGMLSYVLSQTVGGPPTSINFSINITTITFTGAMTIHVPAGVMIDGGSICSPSSAVVINGNGVTGDGLVLNGNDLMRNIWVKGFANRQITTSFLAPSWKKNTLQCVRASR
ncbi:MAG: Ig-like domain repeat protein [Chloroflexi bacterium]|nr:Ig-like domain repeat protein [Chloroflexota bacterium]